jgi:cell division protein FtsI (penicillin-binding protein 3)
MAIFTHRLLMQRRPRAGEKNNVEQHLENTRSRLFFIMCAFGAVFFLITLRLFDLAVWHGKVTGVATQNSNKARVVGRAEITDRNGQLLAVNLATASLYARPALIPDVQEAINHLARALPELSPVELKRRLTSDRSFVWIKRSLTPKEQQAVNQKGIPGLFYTSEERRVYPHGRLFSHILGYVDVDSQGISGVEKSFDDYLQVPSDATEAQVPLELSLDLRVQSVVHEELEKKMKTFSAVGASGIVMDVNTGEIIAMVSLPDFDPHSPAQSSAREKFNSNSLGVYEVGSVLKTMTMAMALEMGKAKMGDHYDVTDPIHIANFTIRDYHPKKGALSFPEIYIHSSNIGTARIAMEIGEDSQKRFLKDWGMLDQLALELPEKASPLYPQNWNKISMLTISYGHGIAVTPVHVVQATAAITNGGIFHNATLLKQKKIPEGRRVIETHTAKDIRKLMRFVVKYGTGKQADVFGYMVGGKTGTADKPTAGRYDTSALVSSFVGVFPMQEPRYALMVMLDEPKGTKETAGFATGGATAAPAVRDIISRIAPILNIIPVDEREPELQREFELKQMKREDEIANFQSL